MSQDYLLTFFFFARMGYQEPPNSWVTVSVTQMTPFSIFLEFP